MNREQMISRWNPGGCPRENLEDLDYFLRLQQTAFPPSPQYSARGWDRRADFWEQQWQSQQKDNQRVADAVAFLDQRGILTSACRIADIGCGPGRFAAAFAKTAHSVVGIDQSPQMVEYGRAFLREQGIRNADLLCRDFATLDLQKEGYEKAFDLVFASLTAAVHNPQGLRKMMAMSREWCLTISHIRRRNRLREQMMEEVFQKPCRRREEGRVFYALFNILYLMGYEPETSYSNRQKITRIQPDEAYAAYVMEHTLGPEEQTKDHAARILRWFQDHAAPDGYLTEVSESVYGRILWNVQEHEERPDYHSVLE